MTDPRDAQPHDDRGGFGPPPPTTPPNQSSFGVPGGKPPAGFGRDGEPEYVVHSGPQPPPPAPFADAPDPFGGPTGATAAPAADRGTPGQGRKGWIIPVAALAVLVVVAAAVYFLFFSADGSDEKNAETPASEQTATDREGDAGSSTASPSESSPSGSSPSAGGAADVAIAGTFAVNGTIESYTGPPTGQLGGTPKTAGAPAFTSAQTWVIDGCTETTCELTVQQGGMTLTLELADGTWTGKTTQQIACTPAAGAMTEATIEIQIPQDGATAKRTLSAQCDEPIEEVDALTLTAQ